MPPEVIETKRSPPIWSVKAGHRYKASYLGPDARQKAEAFARENFGEFTVKELRPLTRKQWSPPVGAK